MPLTEDTLDSRDVFGRYIVRLRDYVKQTHVLPPGSAPVTPHTFERDVMERLVTKRYRVPTWVIALILVAVIALLVSRAVF
jgi:hypothetical protein